MNKDTKIQKGHLAMKTLNKKQIKEIDWRLTQPITSEELDEERAIAWGSYMGMLLGDFLKIIHNYCEDRGRSCLFTTNDWGMPVIWFDVSTAEELYAKQNKEREKAKKENKVDFLNPRKVKPN